MLSSQEKKGAGMVSILTSDCCKEEIKQSNEHEIVAQISSLLGEQPCTLCKAEEIFNAMKYEIARYIISHEYASCSKVNEDLLLWLDEKTSPAGVKRLVEIIEKYLK
jgi:hypothetical protein